MKFLLLLLLLCTRTLIAIGSPAAKHYLIETAEGENHEEKLAKSRKLEKDYMNVYNNGGTMNGDINENSYIGQQSRPQQQYQLQQSQQKSQQPQQYQQQQQSQQKSQQPQQQQQQSQQKSRRQQQYQQQSQRQSRRQQQQQQYQQQQQSQQYQQHQQSQQQNQRSQPYQQQKQQQQQDISIYQ